VVVYFVVISVVWISFRVVIRILSCDSNPSFPFLSFLCFSFFLLFFLFPSFFFFFFISIFISFFLNLPFGMNFVK